MPVLKLEERRDLEDQLKARYDRLFELIGPRRLTHDNEGLSRGLRRGDPSKWVGTVGSQAEIRVAANDLITLVKELARLK